MANQCKNCDSTNTRPDTLIAGRQRYICDDCDHLFFADGGEGKFFLQHHKEEKMKQASVYVGGGAPPGAMPAATAAAAAREDELPAVYNRRQRNRYYEDNKAAILKDLAGLGERGMRRKWHISQATWLSRRKDKPWSGLAVWWGVVQPGEAAKYRPRERLDYERHKEAIIADYRTLPLQEFFRKWKLNSNRWLDWKRRWGISNNGQGRRQLPSVVSGGVTQAEKERLAALVNGAAPPPGEAAARKPETGVAVSGTKAPSAEMKPLVIAPLDPAQGKPDKPPQGEISTLPGVRVVLIPLQAGPPPLPPLPEFDSQWPQDVKLEWLRTYRELSGAGRAG